MLTAVSKLSKVSLFYVLNDLNDITIDPEYSATCGDIDDDLDGVLPRSSMAWIVNSFVTGINRLSQNLVITRLTPS